ncbi:MAG: cytochrome P450 [Anaerolineae bacterium]
MSVSIFEVSHAPESIGGNWRENARQFVADPLVVMNDLCQRGRMVPLVRGGNGPLMFPGRDCPGTVFLFGPDHNRWILTRTDLFHSGPIIGPIYDAAGRDSRFSVLKTVGTGLFSLNGDEHQRQRRLIQPAFHRRQIEEYAAIMVQVAERTLSEWEDGMQLDLQRALFRHTLTVAGLALFGRDFSEGVDFLGSAIQEWLELIPAISLEPDEVHSPEVARFLEVSAGIDREVRSLIAWKRTHPGGTDVLAELTRVHDTDGMALTEDELIGHINILLTAGHETTANVLSWTMFLLALFPNVKDALRTEIKATMGERSTTLAHLSNLDLLDRVIKESMRLLPPVTIGSRLLVEDVEVEGVRIPAGSEVVFSHYHTHHDPGLYPEPERFRPDRWIGLSPSPYEYLPFSTGQRMCIGAPFAIAEIKVTLAAILQRFDFSMVETATINRAVWVPLRPDNMPMRIGSARSPLFLSGNVLQMIVV